MWKIALKQIRKNFKSNIWIFVELFIVSILLWYCVDFLYVIIHKNSEPIGVDTEQVYQVKLGFNPLVEINRKDLDSVDIQWINPFLQIVRLIEQYPDVEAVTYYSGSEPYSQGTMFQGYTADEENAYRALIRYVSEDYDKVFRVNMHEGGFKDWQIKTSPQSAIISQELSDSLFHSQSSIGKQFRDYYTPELKFKVTGVSGSMKNDTYRRYEPFIYTPFHMRFFSYSLPTIAMRVRPEAAIPGFEAKFTEAMKTKLNIGPFYLFSVISYDLRADAYDKVTGISKYVSIITSVLAFFLFIVFLGILGTFWFQMESRRSEIGLRMALGSSRKGVLRYIFSESMIMYAMAFLPAFIVCIKLVRFDITYTFNDGMDYTWTRFWITQLFSVVIMIGIISLGVLLPARRASKMHPVEALRDE